MKTKDTPEQIAAIVKALAELYIYPFTQKSGDAKRNAQLNCGGFTHYFDDDTLRFHKGRVNSTGTLAGGLIFFASCTDALDMHNTRRGHRYVAFDLFGNMVFRPSLEEAKATEKAARKAFEDVITTMSAANQYRSAIASKLSESRQQSTRLETVADAIENV